MAEMVKMATRESFGKALAEFADQYPDVIVLDADLASATKTGIFQKAHPDRFIDCGIQECNMIGVAAGWLPAARFRLLHRLPCSPRVAPLSRYATPLAIRT